MSRTLVAVVSGLACTLVWLLAVSNDTAAQVPAEPRVALRVREAAGRCFDVEALQKRVAFYGEDRLARASDLRLELDVDAAGGAELQVYRGRTLVSRRRFTNLPEGCADRRDAVAVSIALSLEGVIRALSPERPVEPATVPSTTPAPDAPAAPPQFAPAAVEPANDASTAAAAPIERAVEAQPPAATKPASGPDDPPGEVEPDEVDAEPEATAANSGGYAGDRWIAKLHAGGRFIVHAAPSPVFTGLLGVELWLDHASSVELSAIASTLGTSSFAEGRVQSRLIGGELLGCHALAFEQYAAQGCAGLLAAACRSHGRGYAVPFPAATLLWAAGTARLALLWAHQETVSVRLVIQGHVNLVRPELRVDGVRERLNPFWLGGAAGLDLVVSFD